MVPDWHCGCVVDNPEITPQPESGVLGTGNRAGDLVLWVPTLSAEKAERMGHASEIYNYSFLSTPIPYSLIPVPYFYRRPWMVLGLTPAFFRARLAAMACISLPMLGLVDAELDGQVDDVAGAPVERQSRGVGPQHESRTWRAS